MTSGAKPRAYQPKGKDMISGRVKSLDAILATAEKKGLLDQERLETRRGQVVRTEQSRRAAADDDDVAFDEPIEFLEIFPRDLPRRVQMAANSRFRPGASTLGRSATLRSQDDSEPFADS